MLQDLAIKCAQNCFIVRKCRLRNKLIKNMFCNKDYIFSNKKSEVIN